MSALPNKDPLRNALDEISETIDGVGAFKFPQPIYRNPADVQRAEDVSAVLNKTATPEQMSRWLKRVLHAEVAEQINGKIYTDPRSGVADDTVTVELDGDAFDGWVDCDKPTHFTGETSDGDGWEAETAPGNSVIEGTGHVTLILAVKGT